jgi:extracellular elastinolytic metalloproteinase
MPKNLDTRDFTFSRTFDDFAAARTSSENLPGTHEVIVDRVNSFTGSAETLRSTNAASAFGVQPGLGPTVQMLIDRALQHLRSAAPALGFSSSDRVEFVPDPHVKETSAGTRIVNLQQQHKGIPVFQMERVVTFDSNGAVQEVTGSSVGLRPDLEVLPTISLEKAAKAAANYMATSSDRVDSWTKKPIPDSVIDLEEYTPRVLGRIAAPSQPSVLDRGPFGEEIPAHLVFFYEGLTTRLGWHFVISMPGMRAQYVLIVEADSRTADKENPQVIYCQKTSNDVMSVRGNVWVHNPGINQQRQEVDFPRPANDYPISPLPLLPDNFPFPWVNDSGDTTIGNSTIAVLADTSQAFQGVRDNGVLTFNPPEAQGDAQKVVNIFYFCNFMHDFFFMLGFDEPSGNFQEINFTGIGRGGDPVEALAHAGPVEGTANMMTRADGIRAVMNMGLVDGIDRHTAFDSDVVFHEFTHGVSNRLVGSQLNALALQQPQSRGMGEGWSDYFALTVQNYGLENERTVTGDWVINDPAGIRMHPYTDEYAEVGGTYGHIGTAPYTRVHNIGEIWCATLMKMNRDLGKALGDKKRGHLLGWQIVVDGFKLTPANPSFLQARDAILRALADQRYRGILSEIDFKKANRAAWGAFSHFGMGPNATSVGATLFGIQEDKSLPPNL